ncbi:MAG: DUF4124 domain-containing protein [Woeseiaceae bacterium]
MRKLWFITGLLWLCSAANAQQVYKWVDEDGVTHYSDQPPAVSDADAEVLDIKPTEGFSRPAPQALARRSARQNAIDDPVDDPVDGPIIYEQVIIQRPAAQQTLWNIATRLPVEVTVIPKLDAAHRIQFVMDDSPIGPLLDTTRTVLQPVYRGEHKLIATIVDSDGKQLFRSPPTVFYIQQATLGTP